MDIKRAQSSNAYITFVMCLAIFTDVFLYGLIVPTLPYVLVDRLAVPQDRIQLWSSILLALYGGVTFLGSLFFGWLGDRIPNRRYPYILGQGGLGAATLVFAFGKSVETLLVARIFQGLGTAAAFTVGYATIFDAVGTEHIASAMGYTSMALSLGLFSGPLVGGILYDLAGYITVFIPALSLIGLGIILRLFVREPPRSGQRQRQATTAEQQPLFDESRGASRPTDRPARSPWVVLLTQPRLLAALWGVFAINSLATAFESVLPVYARQLFHYSSLQVSLLFLPITLTMLLGPLVGMVTDRYGPKGPAIVGGSIMVPALFLLRLVSNDSRISLVILIVLLSAFGLSVASLQTPMNAEVTYVVEELETTSPGLLGENGAYSTVYGLQNAAFSAGAVVGPLYAGLLNQEYGWGAASLSMGVVAITILAVSIIWTGRGSVASRLSDNSGSEHAVEPEAAAAAAT